MYILYYSPFACSLAAHAVLEKIGKEFQLEKIDIQKNGHQSEAFLQLNPHGQVPVLEHDDKTISQLGAILIYLAEEHPEAGIMPNKESSEHFESIKWLFYQSSTVHPIFSTAFFPDRVTSGSTDEVMHKTMRRIDRVLDEFDQRLAGQPFIVGDTPYAVDYYLFAMFNWLKLFQKSVDPYPSLQSYMKRLSDIPELGKALAKEMAAFG